MPQKAEIIAEPNPATQTLLPPVSAASAMAVLVLATSLLLPTTLPVSLRLAIDCTVGVAAYVGWAMTLHRDSVVMHLRSLRAAWSTQ
jgi:type VI protein secretion system component VasF